MSKVKAHETLWKRVAVELGALENYLEAKDNKALSEREIGKYRDIYIEARIHSLKAFSVYEESKD